MFKQVFRLTFVTFIWTRYKRLIISTTFLFAYLWFVGFAHAEYLNYASKQALDDVGHSFFIKWIALAIGIGCYFLFHFLSPSDKQAKQNPATTPQPGEADPFDAIRQKEKLRSRAEIIIDDNKD